MGGPRGQKWGVKQGGFEGGKIGGLEAYPGAMGLRDPVVLGAFPHMFAFQKFTCTPHTGFLGIRPEFQVETEVCSRFKNLRASRKGCS